MPISSQCNPNQLRDAIAGILDSHSLAELELHLEECPSCLRALDELAADPEDWEKVSDYFGPDSMATSPYANSPTVDIQLNRSSDPQKRFQLVESVVEGNEIQDPVLEPASHPEMLGRIDGFEIEQVIGRGGMGVVYKGFDSELNRPIAIKVLARHLSANGVARQRFAREARAAAAVIHPNVVPIHSVNATAKQPYLVMTLVSGRSLQAHVNKHGPLPVKDVVRIGKQVAAGLAAAHRVGLVHRDIKPANILLEKDVSRVMITDFGLARAADDAAITQTGWLAGTPHYMSPEQAEGNDVDARSDLFSLGSVMYFMATGREPFRADIPVAVLQKITSQTPAAIRSINSDTTRTLSNVIERLMEKQPEDRFSAAEQVEGVLAQYLAHLEQPGSEPKPKIRSTKSAKRFRKTLLAIASLVLLATIAWQFWPDSEPTTPMPQQSPGEFLDWPGGLQSPSNWQNDWLKLEKDIRQLEASDWNSGTSSHFPDPILTEQRSIQAMIEQLEGNLKSHSQ